MACKVVLNYTMRYSKILLDNVDVKLHGESDNKQIDTFIYKYIQAWCHGAPSCF